MVTLMKFIYIFTSIINVIGPIACVEAYKRHNKYARNGWFVATVIWISVQIEFLYVI